MRNRRQSLALRRKEEERRREDGGWRGRFCVGDKKKFCALKKFGARSVRLKETGRLGFVYVGTLDVSSIVYDRKDKNKRMKEWRCRILV